ncbi:hypothetical protein VNI00_016431 [Paramarasmius palmivorus]|uniref:Uncharacterized protein n=1 Tax=Paramarasmius palmivorus TaxID=297713 RepID=A0AAW0BGQ9_9AGAR
MASLCSSLEVALQTFEECKGDRDKDMNAAQSSISQHKASMLEYGAQLVISQRRMIDCASFIENELESASNVSQQNTNATMTIRTILGYTKDEIWQQRLLSLRAVENSDDIHSEVCAEIVFEVRVLM